MFSAAQYLERIEDASVEIQQEKEPVDRTIILWWGVDGLKMDDNGKLEWVSRKKKEPEPEPVQSVPRVGPAYPVFPSCLYGSPTWINPYAPYYIQQQSIAAGQQYSELLSLQQQLSASRMEAVQADRTAKMIEQLTDTCADAHYRSFGI